MFDWYSLHSLSVYFYESIISLLLLGIFDKKLF